MKRASHRVSIDKPVDKLVIEIAALKKISVPQYIEQLIISDVLMHSLRAGKREARTRL